MSAVAVFAAVGAAGYLAIAGFLYFAQDSLIYYPNVPARTVSADPSLIGLAFDDLVLETDDGVRIHAWYVPVEPARGSVIFFHGNAGNIGHRLDTVDILHGLGVNALVVEYRGYGRSNGVPGERGMYLDAGAAWRYLTEVRGVPAREIVLFGRSLGSSVAAWLAARVQPAGLILESGFTSVPDLGAEIYPWLPVRLLSRYQYDTRDQLRRIQVPVLVAHSSQDEVIPYAHGLVLFAAAFDSSHFLEMSGAHGDGFIRTGKRYTEALNEYLIRVLGPPRGALTPGMGSVSAAGDGED